MKIKLCNLTIISARITIMIFLFISYLKGVRILVKMFYWIRFCVRMLIDMTSQGCWNQGDRRDSPPSTNPDFDSNINILLQKFLDLGLQLAPLPHICIPSYGSPSWNALLISNSKSKSSFQMHAMSENSEKVCLSLVNKVNK